LTALSHPIDFGWKMTGRVGQVVAIHRVII